MGLFYLSIPSAARWLPGQLSVLRLPWQPISSVAVEFWSRHLFPVSFRPLIHILSRYFRIRCSFPPYTLSSSASSTLLCKAPIMVKTSSSHLRLCLNVAGEGMHSAKVKTWTSRLDCVCVCARTYVCVCVHMCARRPPVAWVDNRWTFSLSWVFSDWFTFSITSLTIWGINEVTEQNVLFACLLFVFSKR